MKKPNGNGLKPADILARYRNLLIVLARETEHLKDEALAIRKEAQDEKRINRRHGLLAKANARDKHRARLTLILSRNRVILIHFFGTPYLQKIAQLEIVLHP